MDGRTGGRLGAVDLPAVVTCQALTMKPVRASLLPLVGLGLWIFASDKTLSEIGAFLFVVSVVTLVGAAWESRRRSKRAG
jgi:hypothetical protein